MLRCLAANISNYRVEEARRAEKWNDFNERPYFSNMLGRYAPPGLTSALTLNCLERT
jgi:hypothetical protein